MPSRFASLSRDELAVLVPELLLIGQLIDRSGMAWCISAWGREEMAQIAIEEWAGASPIYTRRMQQALRYEGTDVVTIFKGLQLDIGAPPQFMDFRYDVQDPLARHLPPRPLRRADGRRADGRVLRPLDVPRHRGPDLRRHRGRHQPEGAGPAGAPPAAVPCRPRRPHCAWTVIIDESHPPVTPLAPYYVIEQTRAAVVELDPIDPPTRAPPTTPARC